MKQFRKRFLAALLSFVMVFLSMSDIFSAYAGPPAVVDDPDVVANVTYDQSTVASRGNSDFYVGEEVPFYANITMRSGGRSLPGAYSKLYLPKKIFGNYISTSNISPWDSRPATDYLNVDYSSNNEYIIVTMKYTILGSGTTLTVPFKATIQPNSLANNETYTIPWQVYDGNGTLVESSNNTFTAKTYPVGYVNETSNHSTSYGFLQGVSTDLQNNTTLSNNYSSRVYINTYRTNWPAAGTYHGTAQKSYGSDRRKTRLTVQLPANERFDTSDTNNAGWVYNASNHTISKDIQYGNISSTYDHFYIKYNNQPVGTQSSYAYVSFPVTWQFVNDDGSLDTASLQKSVAKVGYYSYPGTPPTDNGLRVYKSGPGTKMLGTRENTVHKYTIYPRWEWYTGNPSTYPVKGAYHHTISSIEDTPRTNEELELVSYKITYPNSTGYVQGATGGTSYESIPVLDTTQQAALSHNKLIGTKPDGSTEIIAPNVSITSSSTEVTLSTPTLYKKIELKFDNPIEVQAISGNIINIEYTFRLAPNSYNSVKTQLAAAADSATILTYNDSKLTGDTNLATQVTSTYQSRAGWNKPYAYEYTHYTQGRNLGTKYMYDVVRVEDDIRFYYNLGPGGRDIKHPKFYALVDPGFEYQGIDVYPSYTPELTPAAVRNYRVEYNFKNTGKTAYIWDLPDINLPEGNNTYRYIYLYPKFKFTRNVTAGPGTIDTYFSWDNNEEVTDGTDIKGLYPDVLDLDNDGNTTEKFSSKKENYIYSPPLELILTKRSKRADAGNAQYLSITTPDSEQIVDYQLNIFNNSINAVTGFTFYDILPHVGDKSIVPNQQGVYTDRGSTYKVTLTGPIDANANYTFEYSTTPVTEGDIDANYGGATWVSSVSDWSQVTMFRAKMKPGYSLASHTTDVLTFKAKMPDTVPLDTTDKAVNTFAGFSGNNYAGAFEALNNTVVPKKYKISGKIYYDVPPTGGTANGTYLTTDDDAPAAGRSVALYKSDGTPVRDASGNPVTTTADANGDYSFDNISTQGTYKVVVTPGTGDTLSGIHVTSTSLVIGNDFNNGTLGGNAVFEANVTVTPTNDKKTANAALEASNSTLKVKYVDMSGNPIPLDDGSGNVPDTDSTHAFRATYSVTPATTLTGVTNFEYAEPDLTNGRPLTGTLNPGQNVVILKYKRKQAGDITVHHYEVGQTTELYKPSGATAPSAEVFDGTQKLGLSENLTNKAADIDNFEYVSVDKTGAGSATAPSATGATTVTYLSTPQTVTYYYKRKNAANITVHHYEDGTTTELYSQTAGGTPSAVTISGTGKLGLTEDLTNKAADIDNYDYAGIDVSGAPSATSPSSTGETTLTHRTTAQTVIYKYRRKDAGNVIVHHYEQGTTTQLVPDITLSGAGKLGLPYTTTTQTIPNFTVVTVPSNQNGTYQSGNQTVTYYYKRNNAGNITVHHYEVGQSTELYKPTGATAPSAEVFDGTGKLGLSETFVNREADIDNYEYVSVDTSGAPGLTATGGSGQTNVTYQTGAQTVIYRYRRKNAADITVHHYEDGTTTELYSPTGGTPGAVTISGAGKLGLTENLTNQAANIANFEYASVDVSGAPSATSPSGTGETTLTHRTTAQTVIYKYKRKDAGNVIVKYVEQGTNTPIQSPNTMSGAGKLGLPYTTTPDTFTNYDLVSATPTGHTGNYPPAGSDITVTYEYKRKNAGSITVNHYIDGTTTQLYKHGGSTTPSAEVFNGTGKLGLSEDLTNKEADIDNYEFVRVDVTGAGGANTPNTTTGATTVTYVAGNQVVNYYYRRKDAANITVHHYEDGTTTELYSPTGGTPSAVVVSGTGKLGVTESFTNKEANIANFEYVGVDTSGAPSATTPSATGTTNLTHGTSPQTLIYKYRRKNAGNVLVHHYEQGTTTQVAGDDNLSGVGKMGLTYNTSPATVPNYTVVNATPTDHTGTYPNTGTTVVTYYYTRNNAGDVTVHHYEQGTTTQVAGDDNLSGTGRLGLPYTTNEKNVPHFTLVGQPANKNGTFTTGVQTVIYEYRRNDAGNVLVHHYESGTTTSVSPDENLSGVGKSGLTYNTSPAAVANYTVVNATPTAHSGNYPASGTTVVTYYYTRNDAGDVTVKYLEQGSGTSLHSDAVLSGAGKLGLPYTTNEENITDYELVAQPANKNGRFTTGSQTVIYEYRRKPAGDVTTVYVDDGGNVISTPDVQSGVGKLGLPYNTTAKTVPNFTLVSTPLNANGVFTSGPQTVTYVYRRSDAGNVTVYHKSVYDNSDLSAPNVLDGTRKLGLPYTTSPESYADFEVSSVPANANGTFASGAQTVTYLYKRKQSGGVRINYLDNHGNRIDNPDTITGSDNVGLPYTTTPKTITNYDLISVPANANGTFTVAPITVNYIYKRKDAGSVTVEHIDENGNVPLETPEVMDGSEKLGLPYTTSAKSFDNFDLLSVPANANGTFTSTDQTVTYVYRRKDAGNVIAHYKDTAGFPIESDEVLDGTRSLGLPYTTTQKDITGYSLYLVQGRETGIFSNGTIEVTYIYRKNPSVVITPVPPVTPTPVTPSPINPISPVTPVIPINPVNPITPSPISPITPVSPSPINPISPVTPVTPINPVNPIIPSPIAPSRIATPSQIITPGRDQDLVIRPNRPIATPSIATSSNGSRGGSGSSGGNANVRPAKAVATNNGQSKNAIDTVVPIIDKPIIETKKPTPQKATIVPDTRKAMSVPKTADSKDVRGYFFILISSLAAAISLVLKKKEDR